jgi:hypothetical protein
MAIGAAQAQFPYAKEVKVQKHKKASKPKKADANWMHNNVLTNPPPSAGRWNEGHELEKAPRYSYDWNIHNKKKSKNGFLVTIVDGKRQVKHKEYIFYKRNGRNIGVMTRIYKKKCDAY